MKVSTHRLLIPTLAISGLVVTYILNVDAPLFSMITM